MSRAEALYALAVSPFILVLLIAVAIAVAYTAGRERGQREAGRYVDALERAAEDYRLSADTEARRVELRRRAWGADE